MRSSEKTCRPVILFGYWDSWPAYCRHVVGGDSCNVRAGIVAAAETGPAFELRVRAEFR